jgi:nucleoside-diphosphate-sugar epimerase
LKALVTGGGGFLGKAVVQALLAEGHDVRSLGRGHYPELEALGAETVRVDLRDRAAMVTATRDRDTVFHVAARTGVWGPRKLYFGTNVDGTRNVLDACKEAGVERLVYTSSPSVCFDGKSHVRVDGSLPYAPRFLCAYPESKAVAERLVLAANGQDGLATCALRPHLIFGPGDPHLIPRLLERGRRGKLAIVGNGDNEVSMTYIENAAGAHLDAVRELRPDATHAGRAYFIAQEEPVRLWDWVAALFERLDVPPVRRRVPLKVAYGLGATLETLWHATGREQEPPMTRFVALQLATSHSYDLGPARRDFGYRERVGMAEATERLVRSLQAEAPAATPVERTPGPS